MDKQSHVCLMLIDLSAAFDTVNHDYLIQRLHTEYLVGGDVINWLKSYFSERSFKVSVMVQYLMKLYLKLEYHKDQFLDLFCSFYTLKDYNS